MYFAHTVGAAILGGYFLFSAYNGIFSMVSDGGFGGAAVKRISEGETSDSYFSAYFSAHFSAYFILRSVFTIIVVLSLLVFRDYFVDLNTSGMFIWLLLAVLVSMSAGPISSGVVGYWQGWNKCHMCRHREYLTYYPSDSGNISGIWSCRSGRWHGSRNTRGSLYRIPFL